jgi:hypothetical protein
MVTRFHPLLLAGAVTWLWLVPVSPAPAQVVEGTISLTRAG